MLYDKDYGNVIVISEESILSVYGDYVSMNQKYHKPDIHGRQIYIMSQDDDVIEYYQKIISKGISNQFIKETKEGYVIIDEDLYARSLCFLIFEKIGKVKNGCENILKFYYEHQSEFLSAIKLDPELILDSTCALRMSMKESICYCVLVLSYKLYPDFFFEVTKKALRKQYKEVQRLNKNPYDECISDLLISTSEGVHIIYDYFFRKKGFECMQLSMLILLIKFFYSMKTHFAILNNDQKKMCKMNRDIYNLSMELDSEKFNFPKSYWKMLNVFCFRPFDIKCIHTYATAATLIASDEHTSSSKEYASSLLFPLMTWKKQNEENIIDFFNGLFKPEILPKAMTAVESTNDDIEALKNKVKCLESKLKESTFQIAKLSKELSHADACKERQRKEFETKLEKMEKTIDSMLEMQNQSIPPDVNDTHPSIEQCVKWLNQFQCVIAGGHDHWIRQMKQLFPNWSFFTECSRNIETRQHIDCIFFFPNHLSHSLFYKFIGLSRSRNIPRYMLENANIDMVVLQLYRYMKNVYAECCEKTQKRG